MRLLGRGGMGEVYEAEDTRKHRVVALKLISGQFSGNPVFRARLQREADAAGRLTEPHVVPIHDYGEIDGQFYVEMRLIDGISLRNVLLRQGPMPPARAVAILSQVASALDAAHAAGVTHRDVKPENILITGNDFAYLVDFGIARAATDPGLTQTGTAVGTYNYMAPERFSGDQVTHSADIYSLACVLAECLTGSPPYPTDSMERLIASHLMQPPPRPSELRPGKIPPALDQVIAKGMAKNPNERYRSAGELARAAHDALTTSEQHQAATILQQSEEETRPARAVAAAPQTTPA
ncbi:serine/threonine-protein kinase, partial [Mycobacterium xenopi]